MANDTFNISYPAIYAGTQKSNINFLKGTPDLIPVFEPGRPEGKRRLFVTDATVASLDCMKEFIARFDDDKCGNDLLLILGSGEPYKTLESVQTIISTAIDAEFTRKDVFVGIGGGVICDITAFAASLFKRGSSVQFVPTTLLAMVDASVGGKCGCDFLNYKNMIGTFFPATDLYYWPEFVQYLPENQFRSGLAEAFKTGLLYDKELYNLFKNESEKINARDKELLDVIIRKSVKAKAMVVEKDFTEQNIRAKLNLGHTFAHALETIAGLGSVTHGDAVAWGIGRAVAVSCNKGYCLEAFVNEIKSILELYGWEAQPIHSQIRGGGVGERFLAVMHKDKKNLNKNIRLILPKADPSNLSDVVTHIEIEEVIDADILAVLK